MEDQIQITDYVENEDGSALITIECSDYVKGLLIEAGFIALIKKHMDEMDNDYSSTD